VRVLPLLTASLLALAPPAPPLRGVELQVASGELVLRVTAAGTATWRASAGGRWMVHCQAAGVPFADEQPATRNAGGTIVPTRLLVHTGIHPASAHMDVCSGSLSVTDQYRGLTPRALTARGATLLDVDLGANATLGAASGVASAYATMGVVPPPGSVPGTAALPAPDALPPAAPKLGYWSDGGGRAIFSTRTAAGRIVVAEFDAPDVLSTNILAYLDARIAKTVPLVPVAAMSAGVTATLSGAGTTFTLPAPLLASLNGTQLDPLCLHLLSDGRAEASGGPVRAAPVVTAPIDLTPSPDACVLRKAFNHRIVARVPVTDAGRRYEELEQARSTTLGALQDAALLGARLGVGLAPTDTLGLNGPVVALPLPGVAPPSDAVGYWTDGVAHAYAATVGSDGRTLWSERDGPILRSNVLFGGS
jgi:hypothetical protein